MKNLILYVLGGATVVGGLLFVKKKRGHAVFEAAASAALPAGKTVETMSANNSTGSINYSPTTNLAGFNVPVKQIVPPKAAPGTVNYPPATTQTDPRVMSGTVSLFQAAAPIPSNFYYKPADGDLWPIVSMRLGGTAKARLVDYANNKQLPIVSSDAAAIGKLNGIVSYSDFGAWIKAGKPLRLPVGGWNDVAGPVTNAMGTIGQ
jgi:hypothetical protein